MFHADSKFSLAFLCKTQTALANKTKPKKLKEAEVSQEHDRDELPTVQPDTDDSFACLDLETYKVVDWHSDSDSGRRRRSLPASIRHEEERSWSPNPALLAYVPQFILDRTTNGSGGYNSSPCLYKRESLESTEPSECSYDDDEDDIGDDDDDDVTTTTDRRHPMQNVPFGGTSQDYIIPLSPCLRRRKVCHDAKRYMPSHPTYDRVVSFGDVQVRYYERIISDTPTCRKGPSLGIGWNYRIGFESTVEEYEELQRIYVNEECLLSRNQREVILKKWGYTDQDIAQSVRQNRRILNRRRQTMQNLGAGTTKVEEFIESIRRKVQKTVRKKRAERA